MTNLKELPSFTRVINYYGHVDEIISYRCRICKGISDIKHKECPYCGSIWWIEL